MSIFTHALLVFLLSLSVFAEESATPETDSVTLAPVIAEGTPAESLKFDPVMPAYTGRTRGRISTGNIAKEIANDLPFHSNSNLKPGNEVGFIGIGKGPEETDVNLLGIPINRPQGGGADLATFPQFFWSGYSYQIGPSLGAFDPRGVGGSLTLRLWTQENLGSDSNRATFFHSDRDIRQYSFAHSAKRYAFVIGQTEDSVVGPALSFSAVPLETGRFRITTHLLYSDTNAKNFVSERSGSATGEQRTYRLIPVVQMDTKLANSLLKTSFFYDGSYIKYEDSADASAKQIKKILQVGNETAWIKGNTRIGFGVRHVKYERSAQNAIGDFPSEQVVNVQASHALRFATGADSDFLIEPTAGGYAVTRKGFYPTGTIGFRHENRFEDGKLGEFLRVGYTKRFPSLLDRYYEFSMAVGPTTTLRAYPNPDLQPENVRSAELGADFAKGRYKTQLTAFAREYKHARYTRSFLVNPFPTVLGFQLVNAGNAWVVGATHSQDYKFSSMFDVGTRLTYQKSRIDDLRAEFPYSPAWVGIVRADIHDSDNRYGLEIVNKAATEFVAYSETSGNPARLPSYYYLDLFLRGEVVPGVTIIGGVENIFDRPIQYRLTSPDEGRIFSIAATANF